MTCVLKVAEYPFIVDAQTAAIEPALKVLLGGGARQLVLGVLVHEWPLTARAAYELVRRQGVGITYQAVHKALAQLYNEGVVERSGTGYRVSNEWAHNLKTFAEQLDLSQDTSRATCQLDLRPGQSITLRFQRVNEIGRYILNLTEREFRARKPELLVWHWRRTWTRAFFGREFFPRLEKLMHVPSLILVRETSIVDRYRADFYERLGARVRVGIDCANTNDLLVANDYIVGVYLARELRERWSGFCERAKNLEQYDQAGFYRALETLRDPSYLIITRNQDIANQIVAETLRFFPEAQNAIE